LKKSSYGITGSFWSNGLSTPLETGDIIIATLAGSFFVDGAVRNPGTFTLGLRNTLTKLLPWWVSESRAREYWRNNILRGASGIELQKISVNINQVVGGSVAEPRIEPHHRVFVPSSTIKYLVQRFMGRIGLVDIPNTISIPAIKAFGK